ncbi:MAG: hypothetical protein JW867_06355 [Candidatus Omnitrophica bacterium]|nr:hypothetical protein [Candidatus Omnitrophota bacterium]
MKKMLLIGFCFILFVSISLFSENMSGNLFVDNITKVNEFVNSQRPLMIGDIIYRTKLAINDESYGYYWLKLRYIGYDSSQIKIRYEFSKDVPENEGKIYEEVSTLIMPLDEQEKTYIKIHQLPKLPEDATVPAKTLVVSVYDRDKSLIKVEEFGKYKSFVDKEKEIEK